MHVTQQYGEDSHTYEIVGVVATRARTGCAGRSNTVSTRQRRSRRPRSARCRFSFGRAARLQRGRLQRVIRQAEPNMPITDTHTVAEGIDRRIVQDRLVARLSLGFGIVALLLASIGLYGVLRTASPAAPTRSACARPLARPRAR